MHPNAALIQRFYTAFQAGDAAGMRACYHPEIIFTDPAFGTLYEDEAGAMWAMLLSRAKDLRVTAGDIAADRQQGRAHWEARYTFGQTGRPVHNIIEATFEFRDGLIVRHRDDFDFWRWARQALGPVGLLLGWAPMVQARVRAQARAGLAAFMEKNAPPPPATPS